MIKLKSLLENDLDGYDFVGFHRQRRERSQYDDTFITDNNYGNTHFREILDSLFNADRNEAMNKGWIDYSWDQYDEKYEEMEEEVADWLNEKGYRWIFVTQNRPIGVTAYGTYVFKVYFRDKDALHIFDDPMGADDIADAYLYHISNPPKFEDYDENLTEEEYKDPHTSPSKESGSPMFDLSAIYPDDLYTSDAARLYGDGRADDQSSIYIIQRAKGRPKLQVKIYRAIPNRNKEIEKKIKDRSSLIGYVSQFGFAPLKNPKASEIFRKLGYNAEDFIKKMSSEIQALEGKKEARIKLNVGDWVSTSKQYAIDHGKSNLQRNYKIVSKTVPAKHLYTDGNSIHEWGYDPS